MEKVLFLRIPENAAVRVDVFVFHYLTMESIYFTKSDPYGSRGLVLADTTRKLLIDFLEPVPSCPVVPVFFCKVPF